MIPPACCAFCMNPGPVTFHLNKSGQLTGKKPDGQPTIATLQFICQCLGINYGPVFNQGMEEPNVSLSFCDNCEIIFREVADIYVNLWEVVGQARRRILESNNDANNSLINNDACAFGGSIHNSENVRRFRRQICASRGGNPDGNNRKESSEGDVAPDNRKRPNEDEDEVDTGGSKKKLKIEEPELCPDIDKGEVESSNVPNPEIIDIDDEEEDEEHNTSAGLDNDNDEEEYESSEEEEEDITISRPHTVFCPLCNKGFHYMGQSYKVHMDLHSLGPVHPRYNCRFCPKPRTITKTLRKHEIEKHSDKLIFHCENDNCTEAYGTDYLLKIHIETHKEAGPFSCYICERDFDTSRTLQAHLIQAHLPKNGIKPPEIVALEESIQNASRTCEICKKIFKRGSYMRKHMKHCKKSEENVSFTCEFCQQIFQSQSAMQRHMAHHQEKTNCCEFCNLKYLRKSDLLKHLINVHETESGREKPFTCSKCQSPFASQLTLQRHEERHTQIWDKSSIELKFCCDICYNWYETLTSLNKHRETYHMPKKPKPKGYLCILCGTSCSSFPKYMYHQRARHPELLIFACSQPSCDKKYSEESLFKTHVKIHGSGAFSCEACTGIENSKTVFLTAEALAEHLSIHNGENQFKCLEDPSSCTESFYNRPRLTDHQIAVHGKKTEFFCEPCNKYFSRWFTWNEHSKNVHPKEDDEVIPCHLCVRTFHTKQALRRHIRGHDKKGPKLQRQRHPCQYCGVQVLNMERHIVLRHPGHGEKIQKLACYFCEKQFSAVCKLQQHMSIHTLEKPNLCHLCKKEYSQLHFLHTHLKKVHGTSNSFASEEMSFSTILAIRRMNKCAGRKSEANTCNIQQDHSSNILTTTIVPGPNHSGHYYPPFQEQQHTQKSSCQSYSNNHPPVEINFDMLID